VSAKSVECKSLISSTMYLNIYFYFYFYSNIKNSELELRSHKKNLRLTYRLELVREKTYLLLVRNQCELTDSC
jgi:hypothetical protein